MANKSYKSMVENKLKTRFKESEQQGFQYLALGRNKTEFMGTEYNAQFEASLFIIVQNSDRQYRMYVKSFGNGVMKNQRFEGKGYKELYNELTELA